MNVRTSKVIKNVGTYKQGTNSGNDAVAVGSARAITVLHIDGCGGNVLNDGGREESGESERIHLL
jgi:hypothetical protein